MAPEYCNRHGWSNSIKTPSLLLFAFAFSSTLTTTTTTTVSARTTPTTTTTKENEFVRKSCKNTTQPEVCYELLHTSTATDLSHLIIDATNGTLQAFLRSMDSFVDVRHRVRDDPQTFSGLNVCMEFLESSGEQVRHTLAAFVKDGSGGSFDLIGAMSDESDCTDTLAPEGSNPIADGGDQKVRAELIRLFDPWIRFAEIAVDLIESSHQAT